MTYDIAYISSVTFFDAKGFMKDNKRIVRYMSKSTGREEYFSSTAAAIEMVNIDDTLVAATTIVGILQLMDTTLARNQLNIIHVVTEMFPETLVPSQVIRAFLAMWRADKRNAVEYLHMVLTSAPKSV